MMISRTTRFLPFLALMAAVNLLAATSLHAAGQDTISRDDPVGAADVVIRTGLRPFSFVSYATAGAGAFFSEGAAIPQFDFAAGFQVFPWFAIGSHYSAAALSPLEHADFGVRLANVPAGYITSSGVELLFTPWAFRTIHPLGRLTLGGASVGCLKNLDGKEGYEAAFEDRYFSASASLGAEMNLTRHVRLALRGGWRFVNNQETLGIRAGALSGPELAATLRVLWKTSFD